MLFGMILPPAFSAYSCSNIRIGLFFMIVRGEGEKEEQHKDISVGYEHINAAQ